MYQLIYGKEYCFDSLWRRQRPQSKLMRKLFTVLPISRRYQRCRRSHKMLICGDRMHGYAHAVGMKTRKPDVVICGAELAKGRTQRD